MKIVQILLLCLLTAYLTEAKTVEKLTAKERSIALIAAHTAVGNLDALKNALNDGLDCGLTINETKEVLVHTYAYAGFPRSLQGLNTLIAVLEARKAAGKIDAIGRAASPITDSGSKYLRGKKTLETLTKTPETGAKTGYAALAPEIEVFLKEHLFADIFDRDVLNYSQREMVTVSILIALGGVEPQLKAHLNIALNTGLTPYQLSQTIATIGGSLGQAKADAAMPILDDVLRARGMRIARHSL